MSPEDGTLGLSERFSAVEQALGRIEAKLDTKVSAEQFAQLARRVELMENGETPLARYMLEQFKETQASVNELRAHGSANAQEAVKEIEEMKTKMAAVEASGAGARVLIKEKQQRSDRFYKMAGVVFAIVAAGNTLVSVIALTNAHP